MKNRISKNLLLTLFCTTQLSVNIIGMEHEQLELIPEIQGKIVTTLFALYVNDIENAIDSYAKDKQFLKSPEQFYFSYTKHTNTIFSNIMHWIEYTCFNPLQKNICFNYQDKKGNTILHHVTNAMLEGHRNINLLYCTRYLLEHKANPNLQNRNGKSAFFRCLRYLQWHNDQNAGCSKGMRKENLDSIIALFLDNHASPHKASQDSAFLIPTLLSCEYCNSIAQITECTDVKPFMNYRDHNDNPIVLLAVKHLNIKLLHKLKNAGADFNIKTPDGLTLFEYTSKMKNDRFSIWHYYLTKENALIEDIINFVKNISQANSQ